ncbi:MAG TPA: EB domain-containing protein [Polyangiaceae bacterium]|nr:EB domain-containing protein [Polyangiaceae bacterium]
MTAPFNGLVALIGVLVLVTAACGPDTKKCEPGTRDCACATEDACKLGLSCTEGTCRVSEAEDNGPVPKNPICRTPCQRSFTDADGNYRECNAEGLMLGCLDDAECDRGTCVPAKRDPAEQVLGEGGSASGPVSAPNEPGKCQINVDCPDFQVCIDGRCYSNCEDDGDCPEKKGCYRNVCRFTCEADADSCPDTTYCSLSDAVSGYCLPLQAAVSPEQDPDAPASGPKASGTFELSHDSFKFSNTELEQSFELVNDAPVAVEFEISKVEHTEYDPEGQILVTEHAMPWLKLGPSGEAEKTDSFKVLVEGGDKVTIDIHNDAEDVPPKWDGTLKIGSVLGERLLRLSYAQGADGRWAGTVAYFAQFGENNLADWAADRGSQAKLAQVGNAFVQRWGALRNGRITMDEFEAMLSATTNGSWTWPSVKDVCPTAACYLYTNAEGFSPYSDSLDDQPIPSGVAQLPMALDLKQEDITHFEGRLVSGSALQYAGDPAVSLRFVSDPAECAADNTSACIALVDSMETRVVVGGRYATSSDDRNCQGLSGFALTKVPWLLPGFMAGTELDASTKLPYTYECRDQLQPFGSAGADLVAQNLSLAGSNPIRDARSRRRELKVVDGLLVNQSKLYLLLEEKFDADFLGSADAPAFSAYAVASLHRANAQLSEDAYQGTQQTDDRDTSVDLSTSVACEPNLVSRALGAGAVLSNATADNLALTLLDGLKPQGTANTVPLDQVHYLCGETGLFDKGRDPAAPAECPPGSGVTYFTGLPAGSDLSTLDCQKTGSCQAVLNGWLADTSKQLLLIDVYACATTDEVLCEKNRADLRENRIFYVPNDAVAVFSPLQDAINVAFRYKTQFANREGRSLGFAPQICVPNSTSAPYCYDPEAIEQLRQRVDCLNHLYRASLSEGRPFSISTTTRGRLFSFLQRSYSYDQVKDPSLPVPITLDGFEKLNAELLIMLGDEAYTKAFKARFDLANSTLVSFEGSKLESGGLDLAGVAGFEMYTLYQATQYYQLTLSRFFALGPFVWSAVTGKAQDNFIHHEMVVSYIDRVMRASTQQSRAWSEIAKRYQTFARPDLARFVIQRAFAGAYIESVALSRLMQNLVTKVTPEQRAQVRKALEDAALTYQAAFASMQEQYAAISDQTGYFGFSPDYVPFPALEPSGPNAFETLLAVAKQSASVAAGKEDLAIAADRSFETDSASFQSELARIRNTYDRQLGEICGTFEGDDGRIYPASSQYAYLNEKAKTLVEPCGMMGNGALFDAIGAVELVKLDIDAADLSASNLFAEIDIDRAHTDSLCRIATDLALYKYETQGKADSLASDIARTKKDISDMKMGLEIIQQVTTLMTCIVGTSSDCGPKAAAAAFWGAASGMVSAMASVAEEDILKQQDQIAELQRAQILYDSDIECQQLEANSVATVAKQWLRLKEIRLQALRAGYHLKLTLGNVDKLWNESKRLLAEQQEAQQLAINVESAKNDPNVRIYKNDAIISAERTFDDAVRTAYQATRVFEYYASQSYVHKGDLALVRLVSRSDFSLEGYLTSLQGAYSEFSESYGTPDARVDILSLRDDVMQIPRISSSGVALSESVRVALFRSALADPALLDGQGQLTVPFSTSFSRLSPATRNHKISHVEAEILGSQVGDTLGRIYLRQSGTGAVEGVDDAKSYYRFPERSAVVNPFFNGVRTFGTEVYRNDHLRDRPYVNTRWEFVFNQRDEQVNQDIQLNALTDIRLYVYYSDFVAP